MEGDGEQREVNVIPGAQRALHGGEIVAGDTGRNALSGGGLFDRLPSHQSFEEPAGAWFGGRGVIV